MLAGFRQGLFDCGLAETVPLLMPPSTATFSNHLRGWVQAARPDVVILGTFDEASFPALPLEVGCVASSSESESWEISSMYQDFHSVAGIAVDQLLQLVHDNSTGPLEVARTYCLSARWIQGASTPGPGVLRPKPRFLR